MKPEVKAKWLEALRSGEYNQTIEGELRSEDGNSFCCLGVLCELHRLETNGPEWVRDASGTTGEPVYGLAYMGSGCYLPGPVIKWAELNDKNPSVYIGGNLSGECLSDLNDQGSNFAELADIIEAEL